MLRNRAGNRIKGTAGGVTTTYRFTGQKSEMPELGLYYYGARWYDSALGLFTSPDTIIPGAGKCGAFA